MSLVGAPPSAIWVLLFCGLIGVAAWRARLVAAGDWSGAPARLAEVVLGVSLALVLAEVLGLAGILSGLSLQIGAGALAAGAVALTWGRRGGGDADGEGAAWPWLGAAGLLVAITGAIWMLGALHVLDGGPMVFDSNWYHLPLAASFARTGSVTAIAPIDPVTLARFYPANSELIHAIGMAIVHRDVLSPLLNVGWMAIALLAGWCIGRPYRAAPLSLLGVAVMLAAHVFSSSQAGSATNDVAATAALLAAAALLVNAFARAGGSGPRWGAVLVAGLAAGLAAGTKIDFLIPIAVLTVGLVIVAGRGARGRTAAVWIAAAFATAGLWYVRNLVVTGNPVPWLRSIGPIHLPSPDQAFGLRPDFAVVHYLGDAGVWSSHFLPGLRVELGDLWSLLLVLALAGMLASIIRPATSILRVLGLVALAGAVAYVFTPLSAGGAAGHPVVFATNLRWLAPFLALGLALLPTLPLRERSVPGALLAVALLAIGAVNLDLSTWADDPNLAAAILVAAVLAGLWLAIVALVRTPTPTYVAAIVLGVAAIGVAAAYTPTSRDYLSDRFRDAPPGTGLASAFEWARHVHDARIELGGTSVAFDQYPLYGDDASNDVSYLGRAGPNGALDPIESCGAWRLAIDAHPVDFVVTAPNFNAADPAHPLPSQEGRWTRLGAGARAVVSDGPLRVFRIRGPLDPRACDRPAAGGAIRRRADAPGSSRARPRAARRATGASPRRSPGPRASPRGAGRRG